MSHPRWQRGQLETQGVIDNFDDECERETCGGDLDFVLAVAGENFAIELKAFLVGEQRIRRPSSGQKQTTTWKAADYFVPDTIGKDLAKLSRWRDGRRFLMTVIYANPGVEGWQQAQ